MLPRPPRLNYDFIFLAAGVIFAVALMLALIAPNETAAPAPGNTAVIVPPQVPLPAATIPTDERAKQVLELFNPTDQSLTHQLNETTVSQQIEQIMATSYILANCHQFSNEAYRDNFRALIVYAQRMKLASNPVEAEARVRQIAQSARASYGLLYRRTRCDDPSLPEHAHQLLDWQRFYLSL